MEDKLLILTKMTSIVTTLLDQYIATNEKAMSQLESIINLWESGKQVEFGIRGAQRIKIEAKCDCGAEAVRTTHSDWCSKGNNQ